MAVVLVHGAGLGGRSWDGVVAELARVAPSLEVVAPDLPGRGDLGALGGLTPQACIDAVLEATPDGPVVLVAHSLGAALVRPVLAVLGERLTHVVLVAPYLAPVGVAPIDLNGWLVRQRYRSRATVSMPPAVARLVMGNRLDRTQRAVLTSLLLPEATVLQRWPQPDVDLSAVPTTWVLPTRDRVFPPRRQRRFMQLSGLSPGVVELDAGHMPLLSHPTELAELVAGLHPG